MQDGSQLRASDADRERVAEALRAHYAAGRITSEELGDRLDAVYGSRTEGELAALGRDLPALRPTAGTGLGIRRRRLYQDAGGAVIASIACVGIWLAAGAHGEFWPAWVMLVAGMRVARDGWRLLGPAAEFEPETGGRGRGHRRERRRDRRSPRDIR